MKGFWNEFWSRDRCMFYAGMLTTLLALIIFAAFYLCF